MDTRHGAFHGAWDACGFMGTKWLQNERAGTPRCPVPGVIVPCS